MNPFIEQKITVYDMIMGSGKSHKIITDIKNHYKQDPESDRRYIVVVPLRTELDRYIKECGTESNFKTPESTKDNPKLKEDFEYLVRHKENIVTTHALWTILDWKALYAIGQGEYTVVIDEVLDCLDTLTFKAITLHELLTQEDPYISIDEGTNRVHWIGSPDYVGTDSFMAIKKRCESGAIYAAVNKTSGEAQLLVWQIPVELFDVSNEIIICTYMFEHSKMRVFFDLNRIEYDVVSFDSDYGLSKQQMRELITILEPTKAWIKTSDGTIFSEGWWRKQTGLKLEKYSRAFINMWNRYYEKLPGIKDRLLWTCSKSASKYDSDGERLIGKKHQFVIAGGKTWIQKRSRATNDYADRDVVIYLANLFNNPLLDSYLNTNGVKLDQDKAALSDMIQFIWRSAIRDKKPITVFIGSNRMRKLLQDWMTE